MGSLALIRNISLILLTKAQINAFQNAVHKCKWTSIKKLPHNFWYWTHDFDFEFIVKCASSQMSISGNTVYIERYNIHWNNRIPRPRGVNMCPDVIKLQGVRKKAKNTISTVWTIRRTLNCQLSQAIILLFETIREDTFWKFAFRNQPTRPYFFIFYSFAIDR